MEEHNLMIEFDFQKLVDDIASKGEGRCSPIFNVSIFEKDIILSNEEQSKLKAFISVQIDEHLQDKSDTNFTGDVKGMGAIHNEPAFHTIVLNIEQAVRDYLNSFSKMVDKLQIYHQKSWPVILKSNGKVDGHSHTNAHLSAVYYLNVPKANGGDLVFFSPIELNLPSNSSGVDFLRPQTYMHVIKPYNGLLVVFPSALRHEVTKYEGDESRLSLSFDFVLTASEEVGSGKIENLAPSIKTWKPFTKQNNG